MTRTNAKRDAKLDRIERRKANRQTREAAAAEGFSSRAAPDRPKRNSRPFQPRTEAQEDYAQAIDFSTFTFGIGPAGTGKTYVAAKKAAEHLRAGGETGTLTRVVLTRPAVEAAGEKLGFLPGKLDEKFGPYMKPLMRELIDDLGEGFVACAIKNERIVQIPLAFMRGETFKDSLIIADEMQNATRDQLKMLLTRIGEDSRMVIDGDPEQTDIGEASGLADAVTRLRDLRGVSVVQFTKADIVRHGIIQHVIERYEVPPRL